MRKSKWTDEQIIGLLQEAETMTPVTEICRRVGLSKETFYRWRKKFGGLQVSDAKRLRQLEEENRRLKRVVADQALNLQVLKDGVGKPW
jgi:putative transposase